MNESVAVLVFLCACSLACAGACAFYAGDRAARSRTVVLAANAMEEALLSAVRDLVAASRESPQAVRAVLDDAIRACVPAVDAVAVFERLEDRAQCVYASGKRLEHFCGIDVALDGTTIVAQALRSGFRCVARPPKLLLHPGDRVSLAVPLLDDGATFAACAAGARVELGPPALELIVALVEQATPAYLLALERDEDRHNAEIDGLTGLLTPRAFRSRLKEQVARARSAPGTCLALAFIDTDHFKEWNDTCGHPSGDEVLRRVADVLRRHAGGHQDFAARNGGDEFCIVFAETEKSQALERARALCSSIAAEAWKELQAGGAAHALTITASVGIAVFPCDAGTAEDLLEKADAAMYHSKHHGRNCISWFDGPSPVADDEGFVQRAGASLL